MTAKPNDPPAKPKKPSIVDLLASNLPDEPFDTFIQRPRGMGGERQSCETFLPRKVTR